METCAQPEFLMKNPHGKIFVIFNNTDPWLAAFPVLKGLEAMGHSVTVISTPSAPSLQLIANAGFSTIMLENFARWDDPAAQKAMEKHFGNMPDCVLVGISDTDAGSEKTAVAAAGTWGIPTVVLIEGWPHMWLAAYDKRDTKLYQQRVQRVCVMDSLAQAKLLEVGYTQDQIVVTGNPFNDVLMDSLKDRNAARVQVYSQFNIASDALVIGYMTTGDPDNLKEERPGHPEWLGHSEEDVLAEFLIALQAAKHQYPDRAIEGIVRVKPHREGVRVKELIANLCPTAHFDNVDYQGRPFPLLASKVVVGRYTLMLEHAALLGIPTISYLPGLTDQSRQPIANKVGLLTALYGQGELATIIARIAKNRAQVLSELRGAQSTREPVGDATGNVVKVLEEYLK